MPHRVLNRPLLTQCCTGARACMQLSIVSLSCTFMSCTCSLPNFLPNNPFLTPCSWMAWCGRISCSCSAARGSCPPSPRSVYHSHRAATRSNGGGTGGTTAAQPPAPSHGSTTGPGCAPTRPASILISLSAQLSINSYSINSRSINSYWINAWCINSSAHACSESSKCLLPGPHAARLPFGQSRAQNESL